MINNIFYLVNKPIINIYIKVTQYFKNIPRFFALSKEKTTYTVAKQLAILLGLRY